jgi:hypothetical protein
LHEKPKIRQTRAQLKKNAVTAKPEKLKAIKEDVSE